jgi:hypothetical protein
MVDIHSTTWQEVHELVSELLANATEVCLSPNANEKLTDYQRGIAFCSKRVLELASGERASKANVIPFE